MRHLLSDVRFAVRLLRRSPGFFATLLGVLVVGIGATTAMFSVVESLLLKPLPYANPEELTMVWRVAPEADHWPASIPDFLDWKAQAASFQHMAATDYRGLSLSSPGSKPEALSGADVSGDFFPMFGLRPLHGRLLGPDDDRFGGPHVAVLAASIWHRRFGSDPGIVGRTITLNSEPYTVVGVAPEGFAFSGPYSDHTDVWTPLATGATYARDSKERGSHFLHIMGRRQPGVTVEQAQAEMARIARNLELTYPDTDAKQGVRLVDLHDALVGSSRAGVWVLFAAVGLVFLIVCANVATLLLTRAQSRRAEMAARAALGATSARLAMQLVTETVVVFLIASVGGALLARGLVGWFASGMVSGSGARTIALGVDSVAVLFSIATCLACGVVFGLVPALAAARIEPHTVLKESAARAGTSRSHRVVQRALVVAQVAFAFALLVGSGLALKAFQRLNDTPPGFDADHLMSARIVLPESKYADDGQVVRFYREVIARVAERPGVTAVAANDTLPMAGSNSSGSFKIEGRAPWPRGDEPNLDRNSVTPGYFATMGIPLLRGREFTDADGPDARLVTILSQAAAERFFPGEDPIGRRIDWGDSDDDAKHRWMEVVGVAGDVRKYGLDAPVPPESYAPMAQHPSRWMVVVARSPRALSLQKELPGIVQSVDPDQAVSSWAMMADRVAGTIGTQRYVALLLGAFALSALLLAVIGIFGLVSYTTAQRTRELGIRMALGSSPGHVVAMVMQDGLRLLGLGLAIGLFCSVLVGRVLASRIVGVHAVDLPVYATIPALLGATCLLACLIPAWRAARIPPAVALRYE
jgi:putative ABC transport system permease protein